MSTEVQDTVFNQISKTLNIDKNNISLDSSLTNDLNATPSQLTEIKMELESILDYQILDEDAQKIKNVGQLVQYIENYHNS